MCQPQHRSAVFEDERCIFPGIASAKHSRLFFGIKARASTGNDSADFLAGVIEGFYGQPWTIDERVDLFGRMAQWGLNTYLYAPKDDLKHRALWRERYSNAEASRLREIIRECNRRKIRFIYALAPGLDIQYARGSERARLKARFKQMLGLGCQHFALLFDDIPDRMDPNDIARWGSLASAQCHVTNTMFRWTREQNAVAVFLFCPTPYCGRMAARKLGGRNYLEIIGRDLLPEIDVFWTGPEIISREITVEHIRGLQKIIRRKPVIWDNLHANDYDGRRFFCGPYTGRPLELRHEVRGLLSNPNNDYALNEIPLRTLAQFVFAKRIWDPRKAYLSAMRDWLPRFQTVTRHISFEDLVLFGDCFYLPHEEGPEAEKLYKQIVALVAEEPRQSKQIARCRSDIARLRNVCAQISELKDRRLFYALSRRIWDLREELDLLNGYLEFRANKNNANAESRSDFHLPGTFRGGMISRLQRLLTLRRDGTFVTGQGVKMAEQNSATSGAGPVGEVKKHRQSLSSVT